MLLEMLNIRFESNMHINRPVDYNDEGRGKCGRSEKNKITRKISQLLLSAFV